MLERPSVTLRWAEGRTRPPSTGQSLDVAAGEGVPQGRLFSCCRWFWQRLVAEDAEPMFSLRCAVCEVSRRSGCCGLCS